jgi:hypothetical protein
MVSLVNSLTNATSKKKHLWEIDLRFALNSSPGWYPCNREARHLTGVDGGRGGVPDQVSRPPLARYFLSSSSFNYSQA